MKQTITLLSIIAVTLSALLYSSCNKTNPTETIIERFTDTIVRYDTVTHVNLRIDTVVRLDYDTIINGVSFDVNEYEYKINDSLLVGTIRATSAIKPIINFDYYVKSFKVKDSVSVIKRDLSGFYYGGSVIVSPLLNSAFIGASYMVKNGDIIDLSIGKEFSTNTNLIKLGFKKRF
jgi:hypothetical protein